MAGRLIVLPSSSQTGLNCRREGELHGLGTHQHLHRPAQDGQEPERRALGEMTLDSLLDIHPSPSCEASRSRALGPALGCCHQPNTNTYSSLASGIVRSRKPYALASATASCSNSVLMMQQTCARLVMALLL